MKAPPPEGGGAFTFESSDEDWKGCPFGDAGFTLGRGKYFSVSHQPKTRKTIFDLGIDLGPPINVNYPLETVDVSR